MREFAACWNEGKFFEAHDALEPLWIRTRRASVERARPLQGLIQLAVALHHLGRGNIVGAKKMVDRALARFDAQAAVPLQKVLETAKRYALDFRDRIDGSDALSLIAARPRIDLE